MNKPDVIRQPLGVIIVTFVVLMIIVIIRAAIMPYPAEMETTADMPLGQLIDGLFHTAVTSSVTVFCIAFINATLLTSIIVKYSVSVVNTYLPMIIYTMTAYGIYVPLNSVSAAIASLLLIASCAEMIAGFRRSYQFGHTFKSAFYLGIIPIIYAPAAILILILPITLILYDRTVREAGGAVVGLLLPFLLCATGWWYAGESWNYLPTQLYEGFMSSDPFISFFGSFIESTITTKIYLCLYIALTLYSVFIIFRKLTSMRTRARKIYLHFLWLLLLCLGLLFTPGGNIISLGLLAVPGGVLASTFFIRHSGWLHLGIYLLLLGLVFTINILPIVR